MVSADALTIFSGIIILFRNSGKSADFPELPFHGRGRNGKQLPFIFTTPLVKKCSRNARRRFWNTNIKIKFR
jgi:hypothetical protein